MHHPKPDVDILYVRRSEGGRGLFQLEVTYKTTKIDLPIYLKLQNMDDDQSK